MEKYPTAFVGSALPGVLGYLDGILPGYPVKMIKMTVATIDGKRVFECPALEDEELRNKIEILFADLPIITKYRNRLPNLKWVHTGWNGVDNLVNVIHKNKEPFPTFTLSKTLGIVNAPYMAEYVIGYVIATEREFFEMKRLQDVKEWGQYKIQIGLPNADVNNCILNGGEKGLKFGKVRKLHSLTIGFLGTGAIAEYTARQCKSLGMKVWGLSRRQKEEKEKSPSFDVYKTVKDLPEFLESCDYICNVLPSTLSTKNLLSGGILEHCKNRKTVFINIGRGDVVDDACIVTAIKNKWLWKAILDVMNTEPLPQDSPLWSLPEVTITPHISGWSTDKSHYEQVLKCFVDNYHRYILSKTIEGY